MKEVKIYGVAVLFVVLTMAHALGQDTYYWQFDYDEDHAAGKGVDALVGGDLQNGWSGTDCNEAASDPVPNPHTEVSAANPKATEDLVTYRNTSLFGFKEYDCTIEGWFLNDGQAEKATILATRHFSVDPANDGKGIWFYMRNWPDTGSGTGDGKVELWVDDGPNDKRFRSLFPLDDGDWHHFAIVWDHDGGNGYVKLYFDGILHDEGTGLGNVDGNRVASPTTTKPFYVGARRSGVNTEFEWDGWLDEFRYTHSGILEPHQFLNYIAADKVIYFEFDENATDPQDAVGDVNLVRLAGGGLRATPAAADPVPNPDGSPAFDGGEAAAAANDYCVEDPLFKLEQTPYFAMGPNRSWTLEGWFKHTDPVVAGAGSWGEFICGTRTTQDGDYDGWTLRMKDNDSLYFTLARTDRNGDAYGGISSAPNTFNDNQWHHFAITWDHDANDDGTPDNGWVQLYVDGKLQGENAGLGGMDGASCNFAVGHRTSGAPSNTWNGWLDEFRLTYDKILTPSDFLNYVPRGTLFIFR